MKTIANLLLITFFLCFSVQTKSFLKGEKNLYFKIYSKISGRCLQGGQNEKDSVVQKSCANIDSQKFKIQWNDDDSATFFAKSNNMVLDVFGSETKDLTNIISYHSHGGVNQRFILNQSGDFWSIKSKNTNGASCIDITGGSKNDGVQAIQYKCHGGDNQLYALELVERS
jgi:hypothetical protein